MSLFIRSEPVLQSGVYLLSGGWVKWPEFLSQKESQKRKIADCYGAMAKKSGITLNVRIDSTHGSVSNLILRMQKRKSKPHCHGCRKP